jgi:very-short-patch-repair endonuclease
MSRSSIDPWTRASAKRMRRDPTEVEKRLWWRLRDLNRIGAGFRRQAAIGPYVADFAWLSARLIVELDGSQHAEETAARDAVRDVWLRERGFRVLRFWNSDVVENLDGVVEAIFQQCRDSLSRPHPTRPVGGPPSPRGGGGTGGEAEETN